MDASELKQHAANRWPEILQFVGGVDFKLLDSSREHPCPKCGGKTRFRLVDESAGAVRCSHCFATKCGDGISAIQWLRGCDMPTAIKLIADHLGIAAGGAGQGKKKNGLRLDTLIAKPFNESRLALWCLRKPPIAPSAAASLNPTLAEHYHHSTIAFPVFGPSFFSGDSESKPVGYILYPANGRTLPVYGPRDGFASKSTKPEKQKPRWEKVKLLAGSQPGYAGQVDRFLPSYPHQITHVWLCEGLTDVLALISDPAFPATHAAITNANGAGKLPTKWMVEPFRDRITYVVYDNSEAGQRGAVGYIDEQGKTRPGWCQFIASVAASTHNIAIPTAAIIDPATSTTPHDPDLRDWFRFAGGSFAALISLAESTETSTLIPSTDAAEPRPDKELTTSESDQSDPSSQSESIAIKIPVDNPQQLARRNLEFYRSSHTRDLKYWKETWFAYNDGQYDEISADHLKSRLTSFIESEFIRACEAETIAYNDWRTSTEYNPAKDKGPPRLRAVSKTIVDSAFQATKSICLLRNSQRINTWIDRRAILQPDQPDDSNDTFVALENGILNLTKLLASLSQPGELSPTEFIEPHSPQWFSKTKLPYPYNPNSNCPHWLAFLDDVFNADSESIDLLQKWFGYLISGETSQQKILFIIGEKRSGKGTIARTIKDLFGEEACCTPTLGDFQRPFALESMIGKTIGLITDARMPESADETAVTEQLLAITGEDPRDIQRKYKTTLAGHRLKIRFTLFSNLLPKFRDISSAFVSRCRFLLTPNTFEGREDFHLQEKLRSELSGIFNWALIGKKNLDQCSTLHQPKSGRTLLKQFKDQTANVSVFLEKECTVNAMPQSPEEQLQIPVDTLFARWNAWCEENGFDHPGTKQNFSRKLHAIKPFIDTKQIRTSIGSRVRTFLNITLKSPEEVERCEDREDGDDFNSNGGEDNHSDEPDLF